MVQRSRTLPRHCLPDLTTIFTISSSTSRVTAYQPYLATIPTISSSTSGEKKGPKKQNIAVSLLTIPPSPLYFHLTLLMVGKTLVQRSRTLSNCELRILLGLDRILAWVGSDPCLGWIGMLLHGRGPRPFRVG